ncbi:trypsin-like serine protease [Micromonospora rubida]|uniref:trypsin-like serine protease n=1 Tax=Micromonospora rubida TaxID=2697657 RepID=UPI001377B62B|nr:trypsin-like serine protease [Micromonospora rubida]NBE82995.1 trypsin-like serine protease [Micromonospora rubida]
MAEVANTAGVRRRAAGIIAGLALGSAAVVAPGTVVQAATSNDGVLKPASDIRGESRTTSSKNFRAGKFTPPSPGVKGDLLPSKRIVGGSEVNVANHPYVVGILTYASDGIYWCTGTVIAPNKVLTAAHCSVDVPGTTLVLAGKNQLLDANNNIPPGGYIGAVASTWTHQGYNLAAQENGTATAFLDDVSVLTLKQDLPSAYPAITLSAQGDQAPYAAGTAADIFGYGLADGDNDDTKLRKATVTMQSNAVCGNVAGQAYDANRMICAGPDNGADTCDGDSGGPILVNGKQVGITDWGYSPCGDKPGYYERISYYADSINADLTRPPLVNADWTGDGHTDLMARDAAGNLRLYVGRGFSNDGRGGFYASGNFSSGWGSAKRVFRVYNWNGDRTPSLMEVDSAGALWIYNTDGQGNAVGQRTRIGTGWGNFTALMVTNNWLGNGLPSLMVRKSNGELWRYTSNGAGGWVNPAGTRIGTGWNGFNLFLTPGAWKGDGKEVLIGRTSTGILKMYQTDQAGGWTNPSGTQIGSGWGGFKNIITPGDWNGDNMMDMLGVNSSNQMRLYTTDGSGNWIDASGKVISTGWGSFNLVF